MICEVIETEAFYSWRMSLRDTEAKDRIRSRIVRAMQGNFGDHHAISGGVSEMRIKYGPGYRLYYTVRGQKIIILLCGGDKDSRQRDIKLALTLNEGV
jgi:putative addiction module killer protein